MYSFYRSDTTMLAMPHLSHPVQLLLVRLEVLPEVGRVDEAVRELEWEQPHLARSLAKGKSPSSVSLSKTLQLRVNRPPNPPGLPSPLAAHLIAHFLFQFT